MKNEIEKKVANIKELYDLLNGQLPITKSTRLLWNDGTADFEIKTEKTKKGKLKLAYYRNGSETTKRVISNSLSRMLADIRSELRNLRKASEEIDHLIFTAEKFRNSYFWDGDNGNCQVRARYCNYWSIDSVDWYDGLDYWHCSYSVDQSRHNTYASGYYKRGDTQTNLKAVRSSKSRVDNLVTLIVETFPEFGENE